MSVPSDARSAADGLFNERPYVLRAIAVALPVLALSQPVGVTISGGVVSEPGSYRLTIRLDASQGSGASGQIVQVIPVTVK